GPQERTHVKSGECASAVPEFDEVATEATLPNPSLDDGRARCLVGDRPLDGLVNLIVDESRGVVCHLRQHELPGDEWQREEVALRPRLVCGQRRVTRG